MKKTLLLLSTTVVLLLSTSCSLISPVEWDFVNYSIEFTIDNNDLLNDADFLSKIKVTYNGEEYRYSKEDSENFRSIGDGMKTRATYAYPLALRCYNKERNPEVPNDILGFGEFRPNNNHKGEHLTIDWGNGRVDTIEFDIYITWRFGDPNVHKNLKLNGKKIDFAPIHLPI